MEFEILSIIGSKTESEFLHKLLGVPTFIMMGTVRDGKLVLNVNPPTEEQFLSALKEVRERHEAEGEHVIFMDVLNNPFEKDVIYYDPEIRTITNGIKAIDVHNILSCEGYSVTVDKGKITSVVKTQEKLTG